jgi:hypothetical protein
MRERLSQTGAGPVARHVRRVRMSERFGEDSAGEGPVDGRRARRVRGR